MNQGINDKPEVTIHQIVERGVFPNNDRLPLLVIKGAFQFDNKLDPDLIEKTFAKNKWQGSWRNGLYPFHHYHSTAHEVLGI